MSFQKFGIAPTSVKLRVKLFDSSVSTGAGKTGLLYSTTGLKISVLQNGQGANGEGTPIVYTSGSTIEAILALGIYANPTSGKCRFQEVDATNLPGIYEIQFSNAVYSLISDASKPMTLLVSINGATDLAQQDLIIECTDQSASQISVDTIDSIVDAILVDTGTSLPGTLTGIEAKVDIVDGNVDAILVDTADMQPRVTAIEVDTGTTIPGQLDSMSGASFSSATDSLEAIRDRGDAAWTSGGAAPTVEQIADAVWDEVASGHTTSDTFGEYFYRMMSGVGTRIKMFLSQLNIVATGNDSAIDATGSGTGAGQKNTGGATGSGQLNTGGATNGSGQINTGFGTEGNGIKNVSNGTSGQLNIGTVSAVNNVASGGPGLRNAGTYGQENVGSSGGPGLLNHSLDGPGMLNQGGVNGAGMNNVGAGTGKDISAPDNDFGITAAPTVEQIRTEMDDNSTQLAAIVEDTGTTIPNQITALNNLSADEVWDEVASGHTTAGTFGEYFYRMMSGVGTRIKMFLAQLNIVATGNDSAIDAAGSGTGAGMKNTGGATGAGQKNIATNNIGLHNVGSAKGQENEGFNIGLVNSGTGSTGSGMQNVGGGFGFRNIANVSGHGMSNEGATNGAGMINAGAGTGKDLSSPDNDLGITSAPTVEQIRTEMDDNSTKLDSILIDTADMQPKIDIIGVTIQAISLKTAPLSYDAFGYVNADAQAIDDSETTSTRLRQAMLGTIHGKVNATPGTSTVLIVKELTNDSEADLNVSDLIINRTLTFISGACKGQMIGITSQTAAASDPITLTTTEMVNYTNISENDEFVIT